MFRKSLFLFPQNSRAKEATVAEQISKILEEAQEVVQAYEDDEDDARIVEETFDCIQACEGLLRKFSKRDVIIEFAKVKIKSMRRGDYFGKA